MVILPYKDRLELFAKYLQQLIMESIGKEKDLDGRTVHQGIAVYGNKGATDQHAYVQQLRDGVNNFFATFIEVLEDRAGHSVEVESGVTSGDYLSSYLQGTRSALYENGRQSLTITIERLYARSVGALMIALYERAVGYYASLVNINAYHQPGVEAGKKMAGAVISLQAKVLSFLHTHPGRLFTAEEVAAALGAEDRTELVFVILRLASANKDHGVGKSPGKHATAQVIMNLLDNSLTYSPPDTPLEIESAASGSWIEIRISDHGPGIPEEHRHPVFEKFSRLPGTEGVRGTGLGLAISKGIVEAHQGKIWVENLPDGGAKFVLALPT